MKPTKQGAVKAVLSYDDLLMEYAVAVTGHSWRDNRIETALWNALPVEHASPVIRGTLDRNTNKWQVFVTVDGWLVVSVHVPEGEGAPIYTRFDLYADKAETVPVAKRKALEEAKQMILATVERPTTTRGKRG